MLTNAQPPKQRESAKMHRHRYMHDGSHVAVVAVAAGVFLTATTAEAMCTPPTRDPTRRIFTGDCDPGFAGPTCQFS